MIFAPKAIQLATSNFLRRSSPIATKRCIPSRCLVPLLNRCFYNDILVEYRDERKLFFKFVMFAD